MRSIVALALFAAAQPLAAQDPLAFMRPKTDRTDEVIGVYRDQPYHAIRPGEVRGAGFLTEGRLLPFGKVLGPVTPEQVRAQSGAPIVMGGTIIGITPPAGATYQPGDTVVIGLLLPAPKDWGQVLVPTGLARVSSHTDRQTLATVITVYGPIRQGQVTLPVEPVALPGNVQLVKASGPAGTILAGRTHRELQQPGGIMFIDLGRGAVKLGDLVELRRQPGPRVNAPDAVDELIAVAQVVSVAEKSSAIKLLRIVAPDIRAGTPVVRVATLPN